MTLYFESTQYTHWRFTNEELLALRESSNEKALKRIFDNDSSSSSFTTPRSYKRKQNILQNTYEEPSEEPPLKRHSFYLSEISESSHRSSLSPAIMMVETTTPFISPRASSPSSSLNILPLSAAEEMSLIHYYVEYISSICHSYGLPLDTTSTAIIFFKRFYLYNSIQEYQPKFLIAASLFLACKIQETPLNTSISISSLFSIKIDYIVLYEIILIENVKFHLNIIHPYKALADYLQQIANIKLYDIKLIQKNAIELLHFYYCRSDLHFLYSPEEIAIAAITLTEKRANLTHYMNYIFHEENINEKKRIYEILNIFTEIKRISESAKSSDHIKLLKILEERMKVNSNPLHNPESAEYKALEEIKEREKRKKREMKLAIIKAQDEAEMTELIGANDVSDLKSEFFLRRWKARKMPSNLD